MIYQNYKTYCSSLVFLCLSGCSNYPHRVSDQEKSKSSLTKEADGRDVTNAAAKEVQAHNFVEIDFSQSSAVLSSGATTSLKAAVQQAQQQGKINQILVLSWADEEYPSKRREKLSKQQGALADNRNLAIKRYFSPMKNVDVETYNMAKQPNTLSRWFNTTDYKLKNSLMAAGLSTTGDELQYPSKASHSIVLITVD